MRREEVEEALNPDVIEDSSFLKLYNQFDELTLYDTPVRNNSDSRHIVGSEI